MNKTLAMIMLLTLLAGCSGHVTTMQDVRAYCRSHTTESTCDSQESLCAEYSELTLRTYESAAQCRKSCQQVRTNFARENLGACTPLLQSVEAKCNEFCDSNYE